MFFAVLLSLPVLFFLEGDSIPIDNGLADEPEIICGPTSIRVNFATENSFEGNVFVKGRFAEDGCRNSYSGEDSAPFMELDFNECGVRRQRSINPKGVFVSVAVVISFHPKFITKVDRAFRFQCFYMEADKTVSASLDVSMLATAFRTQTVPMPVCRYEILQEDENGDPIRFALVGDKVYHKWTCDSETIDTFCMSVHSCFVDDTAEDRHMILDDEGCAVDKFILGNIDYLTDLTAGKGVHVYKFADRNNLYFDCQIKIAVKDPDTPCERPQCQEPTRGKRDVTGGGCQPEDLCVGVSTQLQSLQSSLESPNGVALSGLVICCMILSTSIIFAMYRWKRRTVVVVIQSDSTNQQRPALLSPNQHPGLSGTNHRPALVATPHPALQTANQRPALLSANHRPELRPPSKDPSSVLGPQAPQPKQRPAQARKQIADF